MFTLEKRWFFSRNYWRRMGRSLTTSKVVLPWRSSELVKWFFNWYYLLV